MHSEGTSQEGLEQKGVKQKGPRQRYLHDAESGLISRDEAQLQIVERLQRLFEELESSATDDESWFTRARRLLSFSSNKNDRSLGIYLWGGVGRGKTYLMDLFFNCLPLEKKSRMHFHRFMQRVHGDLADLQGHKDPLQIVAANIAQEASVLCFDEFFILDIGDAMILAGLLESLFDNGVVLVATSNVEPDELYRNGLQRDRFLPAIDLIKANTDVLEIKSETDYRLRSLQQAMLYYSPKSPDTDGVLLERFYALAPDPELVVVDSEITILGRALTARYYCEDVAWFDFQILCDGPRSAFDYVELSRLLHALILSDVPVLDESRNDQARRFVSLIDELYDRRVKLIVAAAAPISDLYSGTSLKFEFERTRSRLLEMQSVAYLSSGHRA